MGIAPCDLCGTVALLTPWRPLPGHEERQCCPKCVAKDRRKRARAAQDNGGAQPGAGRPPKAAKDREDTRWRIVLTARQSARLDAWLRANGAEGDTRHARLKAWALSVICD